MRLIRIKLENWRGVQSSEISLDEGVTIVEGANEAGKSSFIEALNLLFRERDSTKKQELKRVTPKGVDAGSFVEVELRTGQYHLTYCKTFNKKSSTSLFLHEPDNIQLTGVEAHDRVQQILEETIDIGLWQAIQLEQGNDFTQVNLKSSDSLAQALDSAAGGSGAGDGEAVLLDRVKAEYLLYYTERTAKETGELATKRVDVAELEQRIEDAGQALQSMEGDIENSARLAREYASAAAEIPVMQKQLDQHQQSQLQSVTRLEQQKRLAAQLQVQTLKVDALNGKLDDRKRVGKQLQQMQGSLESAKLIVTDLESRRVTVLKALSDAATDRTRLIDIRTRIDDELHLVELASQLRDKLSEQSELSSRLERIAEARAALNEVNEKIASLLIDEKTLAAIDATEKDRREQEVRLSARSPELNITALQDMTVSVDGEDQKLKHSQNIRPDTSSMVSVQISDLARVELSPAADLEALQMKLASAEGKLQKLLLQCAVSTVAQATSAQGQRSVLISQRQGLDTRFKELLDGADEADLQQRQRLLAQKIAQLQKQLADLKADKAYAETKTSDGESTDNVRAVLSGSTVADHDADALATLQQQLRNRLAAADLEIKTVRQKHEDAQQQKANTDTELEVARQRYLSDKSALELLQKEYDRSLAQSDDSSLQTQFEDEQKILSDLNETAESSRQVSVSQGVTDVDGLVKNARAALGRATTQLHNIEKESVELRARLDVLQAQGLHEKLELLRAEHDDASARLQQLQRAARSAKRLWNTLCHHQRLAQLSYARPLAERVAQMGRMVFGQDFSIQLSESLTIESRTLNGLTVPFDDLSGGAREQLGILLRLAAAQLVSGAQGMPLILDDTLGHTDPDRLETMGAILSNAGKHAQIVVMTCYPRRYGYVGEAKVVKLGAKDKAFGTQVQLPGFAEPV